MGKLYRDNVHTTVTHRESTCILSTFWVRILVEKVMIFSMIFRTFVDGKTVQRQRTRKSATSRFYWYLQYFLMIFLITETDRVGRNYIK